MSDENPIKEVSDLLTTKKVLCPDNPEHGYFNAQLLPLFNKETWSKCPKCYSERYNDAIDEKIKDRKTEQHHAKIQARIEKAKIPLRFKGSEFKSFIPGNEVQKNVLKKCIDFANKFDIESETPESLFLVGLYGTGKTHLAISILKHAIYEKNGSGIYTTVGRMVRDIRSSYRYKSEHTEQELIDKYVNYPLLIIDEVGVQSGTENEKNLLFEVINGRYENYKSNILISNLGGDGVTEYLGKRAMDRLVNKEWIVKFNWESFRRKG
jgi:DNA replication protein DnaC